MNKKWIVLYTQCTKSFFTIKYGDDVTAIIPLADVKSLSMEDLSNFITGTLNEMMDQ